ncbi:unnamed protein product [Pleuronectes platessa]|uniref:Uncharacterized protein n=1 Tax=Pleuronectes platessa TaxID=8262 RepID=A0A9N7TYP5_PLEPL|nr:unnamed protein product [Pleuronectes platessa]
MEDESKASEMKAHPPQCEGLPPAHGQQVPPLYRCAPARSPPADEMQPHAERRHARPVCVARGRRRCRSPSVACELCTGEGPAAVSVGSREEDTLLRWRRITNTSRVTHKESVTTITTLPGGTFKIKARLP